MQKQKRVRKHLTSAQRFEVLEAYRGSELTQREFADLHGIKVSTLQSWLRKAPPSPSSNVGRFVQLPDLLAGRPSGVNYQLRFPNGLVLEIGYGFNSEELVRLLQILQPS
jgi:hypothetical protein